MTKYKISAREAAVIGVHTARYIVKSRRSWSDLFVLPVCRMLECATPCHKGVEPVIMINTWAHILHTRAFFMIRDKCRALDRKRKPPRTKPVKLTEKELGAVAWLYTCATFGNYSSIVIHEACSFLEKHAAHFTPEDVSWIAGLIRQTLRDAGGGNESDRARWKEALHALEHVSGEQDTVASVNGAREDEA